MLNGDYFTSVEQEKGGILSCLAELCLILEEIIDILALRKSYFHMIYSPALFGRRTTPTPLPKTFSLILPNFDPFREAHARSSNRGSVLVCVICSHHHHSYH